MSEAIDAIRDERNHWRRRAERAEAELAALRERVRIVAEKWRNGPATAHHAWTAAMALERLLDGDTGLEEAGGWLQIPGDDDTTGAASGEGEK